MPRVKVEIAGKHFLLTQNDLDVLNGLLDGLDAVSTRYNNKTEEYEDVITHCAGLTLTMVQTTKWVSEQ